MCTSEPRFALRPSFRSQNVFDIRTSHRIVTGLLQSRVSISITTRVNNGDGRVFGEARRISTDICCARGGLGPFKSRQSRALAAHAVRKNSAPRTNTALCRSELSPARPPPCTRSARWRHGVRRSIVSTSARICFQALHPLIRTSQVSLSSNPDADFRYSSIFTTVGIYKGRVFAIKNVKKKSIDITRAMKKELKVVSESFFLCACVCVGKRNCQPKTMPGPSRGSTGTAIVKRYRLRLFRLSFKQI